MVTEVVNNETIVEEIAQEIKDNIAEATNAEVEVVATTETVMESKEEKNENVQSVEMKESNESSKEDEKNSLDTEIIKNSEEEKTQNIEEAVKDKFAEVKEGVTETIEKVKKGAKDGIKKIKTQELQLRPYHNFPQQAEHCKRKIFKDLKTKFSGIKNTNI